mmetsp:Transcript_8604/g.34078  ORF Transcript_8604/g.34078 Transcript_8604/m.34078 type:complete len:226 (+) Transcript_8604:49-726(+)
MARRRSRAGGEELRKHALCPRRNFHVVCLRKVHERFLDVIANLSTLARLAIDVFATFDLFGDDGRSTGDAGVVAALEELFEELLVKVDVVVKLRLASLTFVQAIDVDGFGFVLVVIVGFFAPHGGASLTDANRRAALRRLRLFNQTRGRAHGGRYLLRDGLVERLQTAARASANRFTHGDGGFSVPSIARRVAVVCERSVSGVVLRPRVVQVVVHTNHRSVRAEI